MNHADEIRRIARLVGIAFSLGWAEELKMHADALEAELAAAKLAHGREWRARHCEPDPPVEGKEQRRG